MELGLGVGLELGLGLGLGLELGLGLKLGLGLGLGCCAAHARPTRPPRCCCSFSGETWLGLVVSG